MSPYETREHEELLHAMGVSPQADETCPEMQELTKWLGIYGQLTVGDMSWSYRSFADLVADHGRFYRPAPWSMTDPHQPGHCFRAAREWADRTGWTYVEGFALVPSAPPFTVIEHAWCLTHEGYIADPALPDGTATGYLGVPLDAAFRRGQQRSRGTDAVFVSDPSNPLAGINEQILRSGLPEHALHAGT
ncbi:hypothetical protein [Streptomyces sp. NPDC004528]|uniref:hypothetical protein n=1 Tax=Streptomyces sp. NPDC004528 TaxID=3154550 RepID=UPI0033B27AE8